MAVTSQQDDDIISGINVTPLVDIILVVLIIFIVTASLVLRNNIPVELPQAQTGEQSVEGLINLAVTAQGELYLNGRPGVLEDISGLVAEVRQKVKESGGKVSAFISADTQARYGKFAEVIDRLRLEGVSDIALDTQPPEIAKEQP
jgi:biopolymer transport protein TolR